MNRPLICLLCCMATCAALLPSSAMALQPPPPKEKPAPTFSSNLRMRAIHMPAFVLDIWFDQHANTWENGQVNLSYGADFGWRKNNGDGSGYELSLAVDYANLSMKSAFWKEEGEPSTAAKYTEVDLQVLSFTFSSNWFWDVTRWFSPYVGVGIGAGVVLGDIVKFRAKQGSDCQGDLGGSDPFRPPACFDNEGNPNPDQINLNDPEKEEGILPVVPMVQLSAGARFNIYDYGVLKLEVGLHNYLYGGMSFGVQW